jgi:predicted outer membrane repeat protein
MEARMWRRRLGRLGVLLSLTIAALSLWAAPASAAIFPVTTNADSGAGSLRQAITDANSNGTADDIPINVTGNIDLLSALPLITTPMTITGPGANNLNVRRASSVPAGTQFRFLALTHPSGATVTIQGLTMSGARATGFAGGAVIMGGLGTLMLDSVLFDDNRSGQGGAVFFDRGFTSIRNSTFSNNQADFGGAILGSQFTPNVGNGEIVNSTIVGNKANDFGGGVYTNVSHIQILSSTIVNNVGAADDTGGGGGTYNGASDALAFNVANTLYAGNVIGTTSPVADQCGGAHTSSGYNLRATAEAGCTGFTGTGDVVNANPMIGSLGQNGGPTPTIPLLTGSPAINAGNPATPADNTFPACPTTDQRGLPRGAGGNRCDIGAFEVQRNPTTTAVACAPTSLTLGTGSSTCTATVTDAGSSPTAPTGSVAFSSTGTGAFSGAGSCALGSPSGSQASCEITYTPSAVGTGSHQITGSYGGDADHDVSQGFALVGVLAPPGTAPTGTEALSNAFTVGAITRNKKKGTATVTVNVPNPGELTASGNGVKAASAGGAAISKSVGAGQAQLLIKAKGKKKRKLNETGKVKLNVAITYTPTGGSPNTQAVKVKLKKKL